jgi:limonene-1,2-epoxide hydrolase
MKVTNTAANVEKCTTYVGFEVMTERLDEISLPPATVHFLLGLIFEPEDGGEMFFSNIWLSSKYRESQSRKPQSLY